VQDKVNGLGQVDPEVVKAAVADAVREAMPEIVQAVKDSIAANPPTVDIAAIAAASLAATREQFNK